jgi:hypothetical protein
VAEGEEMDLKRVAAVCALLLAAAAAHAEENCGSMMRTVTRFRGTIRSIALIGKGTVELAPIDSDSRYAVAVEIAGVEGASSPLRSGETRAFGVHSPARTFGSARPGTTVSLEAEWMQCDGTFRRFISLRRFPAKRVVEAYDGWLEIGHSYRAEAMWDSDGELTFVKSLYFPMHHAVGVNWTNLPPRSSDVRSVVFEVTAVEIRQVAEWEWHTLWELKFIPTPKR